MLIWLITKFSNIYFTIPLWIILFGLFKLTNFQYLSILICSELFEGLDTLNFGPVSIIQILALWLLFKVLIKLNLNKIYILFSSKVFLLLIVVSVYFSTSYYSYFNSITLSTINWLFILVLTVLTFNGRKDELIFFSRLFVVSVVICTLQTFLVQAYFYPEFNLAKKFAVNNSNHLGFFILLAILFIILLHGIDLPRYRKSLKNIFYFFSLYLIFSGGRLNLFILFLFLIFIFINPVKTFWITKIKIFKFFLLALIFLTISQSTNSLILRNTENVSFSKYNNIDDLEDSDLGAFTSGRSAFYLEAINLINAKFYFGNGFLSWTDINNPYNTSIAKNGKERYSLHSTILQYWAETGLLGLSLYILYLSIISVTGKKLIKKNNLQLKLSGVICIYLPVFMVLGGTLDNHNIGYSILHFTAGLGIVLFYNSKNNIKHFSY